MAAGPNKTKLTRYLTGANEDAIRLAGDDWKFKGDTLRAVADALERRGPALAEKLGKDSKTAARLRESLLQSAAHMGSEGWKLKQAGQALDEVSAIVEIARVERETMADLTAPPPYKETPPAGSQPTPEEITKAANERAASNSEHAAYQSSLDAQENAAAKTLAKMDEAFLTAIPPMMAIHGGPDPTAPAPAGPGGPEGPGLKAAPTSGGFVRRSGVFRLRDDGDTRAERREREELAERNRQEEKERRAEAEARERDRQERMHRDELARREELARQERERLDRERQHLTPVPHHHPVTNVPGSTDSGSTYQNVPSAAAPGSAGSAGAVSPIGGGAAAGAAGAAAAGAGAGMTRGGGLRGGSSPLKAGSVRGIGAGGTAAAPSALTRGASAGGVAGRMAAPASSAPGSSARASAAASVSRGAAGSSGQSGAAGSTSRSTGAGGRAGAAGAAGAAKGSARGGTGGAAGSTSGKGQGKGLFRRGSNGSTAGGRSGNKAKDGSATAADALVYEQDWLGDDSAAPGVLG